MSELDGWLYDGEGLYGEPTDPPDSRARPEARPPVQQPNGRPMIYWVPIACPRCGARKPRTTGQYPDKTKRYHQCQNRACRLKFDSEELDPTPHIKRPE